MVFKTKINSKDYLRLCFYLTYRKPFTIIFTTLSFVLIVMGILQLTGRFYFGLDAMFTGLFAFYILFIPAMLYFKAARNFASNKRIQQPVEYEFTKEKMISKGAGFISESALDGLYRVEETRDWFLVYQSKLVANLIPKKDMMPDEITGLRNIFKNLSGIKLRLKS
ncbi:YcxB family protein [Flavobacterium pallidum]|uniref:YcxB-like C-terminal domain-containing protein n=1 Tax=Flavobacterium pallidum TaxID=2172098 RepID=A0A2S1SJP1_9FLAO|nr:YcxB family protein [Flavobacterium pallidum]AWI26595.1 hypothetical protein HYN49_12190 [Flavobacterium pallidum]